MSVACSRSQTTGESSTKVTTFRAGLTSCLAMRWPALSFALLLAGGLAAPLAADARGGGGGGGFHGGGGGGGFHGGGGGGGGAYRFSAPRQEEAPRQEAAPRTDAAPAERSLDQGYRGSHPLYGAGSRSPWTGHNMSTDQFRRDGAGGWNGNRGFDNREFNNRGFDNDRFNRQVNLENNFYNRNYGGWNNAWSDGGYWGSRPWGYGWYNWSPDSWGWWGGASVGWGLAALAGADVITSLVNDAAAEQSPVIDVPNSNYQLNYGTVDSVGSGGADFSYAIADSPPIKGAANCQQGLIDGQVPSSAAQAQLLNAACQVAYGPDPKGTPLPESLAGNLPGWLRDLLVLALGAGLATGAGLIVNRRRRQPPQSPQA